LGSTYVDNITAEGFLVKVSIDTADGDDPRRGLQAAAELAGWPNNSRKRRCVALASPGWWAEIATHLGVSKQAAHRKYRGRLPGRA
jgi:hypothetical protein